MKENNSRKSTEKKQRKIALKTLWRDVLTHEKKYLILGWGSMVVSSLSNIAVPALIGTVLDITTSKGAVVSPSSSATALNNGGGKSWSIFTSFRNLLGGKFAFRLNNSTSISPNASQATTRSREIEGKDIGRIWLVMIGVFFVGGTASFLRTHCLKMAKESTVRRLRKKILVQMIL